MLAIEITSESIIALLKIIAIDIILSGDNAIVIAMATRNLPKQQQNKAIFLGTFGAVVLRIAFAALIVYLLKVPYVHLIGGLLLLWIAYNVLVDDEEKIDIQSAANLPKAILTIIIADAAMSLDNVVAVAGAANGQVGMIALGVAISIPIMLFGSKLIVRVLDKYSWIAYVGAGILAWTAAEMITSEKDIINLLELDNDILLYAVMIGMTAAVLFIGYMKKNKKEV